MKKRRFPRLLLCLALILAIFVSGVTTPGFLLPIFGKLAPKEKQEIQVSPVPELTYPGTDRDGLGHSSSFTLQPQPGFTVYAPENAFYEETVMTVGPLEEDKFREFDEKLKSLTDGDEVLIDAWRVDAGLSSEEFMPGRFMVTIDLAEMGVPEQLWPFAKPYHISEDGEFAVYAYELKGSVLSFESNQNFSIAVAIGTGIAALTLTICADYGAAAGVWLGGMDKIPVYENAIAVDAVTGGSTGKFICDLHLDKQDIANWPINMENQIQKTIQEEATAMAAEALGQIYENSANMPTYDEQIREMKIWESMFKVELAEKYKPQLEALAEEKRKMAEQAGYTPQMLTDIGKYIQDAYKYLGELGIQLPSKGFDVYLKRNMTDNATTSTTFYGGYAYIILRSIDYEQGDSGRLQLRCTIVHEMVHVAQSEYKLWSLTNTRYNESTAQLIEIAYVEKNNIRASQVNAYLYNMFGVPMNALVGIYQYEHAGIENASTSAYVWWQFLKYLMDRNPDVTYANLLEAYRQHWGRPEFSTLVITAFHLETIENLRAEFYNFCVLKQDIFKVASKLAYRDGVPTFPVTKADVEAGNQNRAYLYSNTMSMRLRRFEPSVGDDTSKMYGMLLVPSNTSVKLTIDLVAVGNKNCVGCKNGLFYNPVPAATLKERYMLEIDTMGNKELYTPQGDDIGTAIHRIYHPPTYYDVYTLIPPDEVKSVARGKYLRFLLPEASLVGKKGYVDGYRVTIMASEGMTAPKDYYYPISESGRVKKILLTEFISEDLIERALLDEKEDRRIYFTISACEYIEDKDGTKHFGPESHQSGMDELLSQMGAMTGKITISIYWPTKDDLDLHCITPDGDHIYFGNQSAGGGKLDVDMQVQGESDSGAENIYFEHPVSGDYEIYVDNYTDRTDGYESSCRIRVKIGDMVIIDTTESVGSRSRTFTFTYLGDGTDDDDDGL